MRLALLSGEWEQIARLLLAATASTTSQVHDASSFQRLYPVPLGVPGGVPVLGCTSVRKSDPSGPSGWSCCARVSGRIQRVRGTGPASIFTWPAYFWVPAPKLDLLVLLRAMRAPMVLRDLNWDLPVRRPRSPSCREIPWWCGP